MTYALIGDIGRHAVHDGPGIRTTVFFKGCQLGCPWCHNPEFIAPRPEIAFYPERCLACGDCLSICPVQAIDLARPGRINRELCTGCGLCAETCPALALRLVGKSYALDELEEILLRDRLFYQTSGGGVTLAGGEPTTQLAFCGKLLQRLKQADIHTALQTNGFFPWPEFEKNCLPWLDLILLDLKIADPAKHRQHTGQANAPILANLARLTATRPDDLVVRIPLIPGYTATEENLTNLAEIMHAAGVRKYSLLGYHPHGNSKAASVGRAPGLSLPDQPMPPATVDQWHRLCPWPEPVEF